MKVYLAAYFPVGRFIPYTVTKYAVRALMESLNSELRMDGLQNTIQTTCVYPALIATRQQFMDMLDKLKYLDDACGRRLAVGGGIEMITAFTIFLAS